MHVPAHVHFQLRGCATKFQPFFENFDYSNSKFGRKLLCKYWMVFCTVDLEEIKSSILISKVIYLLLLPWIYVGWYFILYHLHKSMKHLNQLEGSSFNAFNEKCLQVILKLFWNKAEYSVWLLLNDYRDCYSIKLWHF